MNKRSKLKALIAVFSALVIGPLTYMILDNTHPYTFHKGELIPNPASNGQTVDVIWDISINRFCPGVVYRKVIGPTDVSGGAIVHNYDPSIAILNPRTSDHLANNKFIVTFALPSGVFSGDFIYSVLIEYNCNPLQLVFPLRVQLPLVYFIIKNDGYKQNK